MHSTAVVGITAFSQLSLKLFILLTSRVGNMVQLLKYFLNMWESLAPIPSIDSQHMPVILTPMQQKQEDLLKVILG